MRFDDSLRTVLSAEATSDVGVQAAWRQLVDLVGRRRVPADEAAMARLRALRGAAPAAVRAASARSLAFATPPAALVALFGEDSLDVAAPVLRTAVLDGGEWNGILPGLTPAGRSILRHRRDMPEETIRALQAFGATDFVLEHAGASVAPASGSPMPADDSADAPVVPPQDVLPGDTPRFEIADLVARIDAFKRTGERPRSESIAATTPTVEPVAPADAFRFETDAASVVRWVDGVTRTPLVGLSLAHAAVQGQAQVDGVVAGACRRRSSFRDARLLIGGTSDAAGDWRLSGTPAFDPATGRFVGYRGNARRPRADESAGPHRRQQASESLRQLVHELRTPTNAIAGFAELIETQLFGPVADPYREHAAAILGQTHALIGAIDDLDAAARIEGGALELRPAAIALHPLVMRTVADLRPLADLRGAIIAPPADGADAKVLGDSAAVERLVTRMFAALVSAAGNGEHLSITIADAGTTVSLVVDKPAMLDVADENGDMEGAPLLGTAFALRLAGNLAAELGGALIVDAERLTLRLPVAVDRDMGQASNT